MVVVGVPAVLDRLHLRYGAAAAAGTRQAARPRCDRGCGSLPALAASWASSSSTRRSGRSSGASRTSAGHELRRARQLRLVLHQPTTPRRAAQQRAVGRLADRSSRSASACSSRSSSTASATRPWRSRVIFVPLAISMVAAGVIWKFMYDYQRAGRAPDRHAERGHRDVRAGPGRRGCRQPTLRAQHVRADRRHGLDVDRLRHGHHLGRAQGHQRRSCSRRPASTAPTSGRSSGGSSSRCWCRRSPSSRRR